MISNLENVSGDMSAREIGDIFIAKGIDKVVFANLDGNVVASDPRADFMIPVIRNSTEWRNLEAVLMKVDSLTQCIYIVSIHSTVRGRSEGGCRLRTYASFGAGLNDCLALSYGMTEKNAYAQIWEGGAKSVIIPFSETIFDALMLEQAKNERESLGPFRKLLWRNYGGFVAEMQGLYLVGEDMNLNSWDMQTILRYNVHTSCLPKSVGGAGNPSPKTAKGIYKAILATCETVFPESPTIQDKRIILKGAGLVGAALAELLEEAGAALIVYDTDPQARKRLSNLAGKVDLRIIDKSTNDELVLLRSVEADIFSPNAQSGTLTRDVVDALRVKAIVGAENAQIARDDKEDIIEKLHALGIVYIPEPCVNTMGVFSAYQEHIGILYSDFDVEADAIHDNTKILLEQARDQDTKPYDIFTRQALKSAEEINPLLKHRGIRIIGELLKSWAPKIEG